MTNMNSNNRTYWLDLFSVKTWNEFLKSGGDVSGFRKSRQKTVMRMKPGDYLLCYVIGISRFIGVLEVISDPYFDDSSEIWSMDVFPSRVKVKIVANLDFETAVPIKDIQELSFFNVENKSNKYWVSWVRSSPWQWKESDGELVVSVIKEAVKNPVHRSIDPKKLTNKQPVSVETSEGKVVTIPEDEPKETTDSNEDSIYSHSDIQFVLTKFGYDLGLKTWVPKNDRNRAGKYGLVGEAPGLIDKLPINFDEATRKTIEMIDVIWLKGKTIVSAFEIEHTTSIFSGLLRMSDLISLQPNINISLYIVAPAERRENVVKQIKRPTFSHLEPPLPDICGYISYESLLEGIDKTKDIIKYIKPSYIDEIAETYELE
jgi:predicted RNA-binding protein